MFFNDYKIHRRRDSRFIFLLLFHLSKQLFKKKNKKTFKNLFNNDLTFEFIHFVEGIFENLFNNDLIFEFVYFNETIILDMRSSIL